MFSNKNDMINSKTKLNKQLKILVIIKHLGFMLKDSSLVNFSISANYCNNDDIMKANVLINEGYTRLTNLENKDRLFIPKYFKNITLEVVGVSLVQILQSKKEEDLSIDISNYLMENGQESYKYDELREERIEFDFLMYIVHLLNSVKIINY
jgi:hypothetical protein